MALARLLICIEKSDIIILIMKILKSKIFWFFLALLVIGGGLVYMIFGRQAKPVEYVTQEVKRGNVVQTVTATGKVKSHSEISLNFKNAGKLSVKNVKVGDAVKVNDVLAQLKATDLAINVQKAQAALTEARANLAKLKTGATQTDVAVSQAAVDKAAADLASSKDDLQNTKETYQQSLANTRLSLLSDIGAAITKGEISLQKIDDAINYEGSKANISFSDYVLEIKVENDFETAQLKMTAAAGSYAAAKTDLSDAKIDAAVDDSLSAITFLSQTLDNLAQLLTTTIITSTVTLADLDTLKTTNNTERTTTNTSLTTLQTDKNSLAVARLTYQTKVQAAENAVRAAERNLSSAQASLNYKIAPPRSEDITLYEVAVRRAEADLQLASDQYNDTILRAPIDGVITDVAYEIGEQTSLTVPVIKMLADEKYEVEVDIPESDIVKINTGDAVQITFDAFSSDDNFIGQVIKIDPAQTEIQDVIYYKVTVAISADQPEAVKALQDKIKPGMTANVTVSTARAENVLIIPLRSVKEENGRKIVEVLQEEKPVSVPVEIGLRGDEGLVEVKSGLTEGQLVITFVREAK